MILIPNAGYLLLKEVKDDSSGFEVTRGVGTGNYIVVKSEESDEEGCIVWIDRSKVKSIVVGEEFFVVKREDILLFQYE